MERKERSGPWSTFEGLLQMLEKQPWSSLYRVAIGLAVPPTLVLLAGKGHSAGLLIPFFFAVLLGLRAVPVALRRLLPFSRELQEFWAERRFLAKRYDSYQWQKLFWIGLGLALATLVTDGFGSAGVTFSLSCVLAGALGQWKWRATGAGLKVSR
jgi:hypothetical protein